MVLIVSCVLFVFCCLTFVVFFFCLSVGACLVFGIVVCCVWIVVWRLLFDVLRGVLFIVVWCLLVGCVFLVCLLVFGV